MFAFFFKKVPSLFLFFVLLISCGSSSETSTVPTQQNKKAEVALVSTSGVENAYTFNVTIKSPDTGCSQYANWWEVITEDGTLIYRRILGHSHVNEQPFTRSGGRVAISSDKIVIIRAHMNTSGYGTITFKGSVDNRFSSFTTDTAFANSLSTQQPLPSGCAF